MQTLHISDEAASQLTTLAAAEHVSATELMEQLIKKRSDDASRKKGLQAFFQSYQKDLTGFQFDRDEANAR